MDVVPVKTDFLVVGQNNAIPKTNFQEYSVCVTIKLCHHFKWKLMSINKFQWNNETSSIPPVNVTTFFCTKRTQFFLTRCCGVWRSKEINVHYLRKYRQRLSLSRNKYISYVLRNSKNQQQNVKKKKQHKNANRTAWVILSEKREIIKQTNKQAHRLIQGNEWEMGTAVSYIMICFCSENFPKLLKINKMCVLMNL